MVEIPISPENKIKKLLNDTKILSNRRPYLGYSGLNVSCKRKIWYNFRWAKKQREITQKHQRLFNRGLQEEPIIIKELEEIGCKIHSQQLRIEGYENHVYGHIDGIIENVPNIEGKLLLEIKTANDKRFQKMEKLGIQMSDSVYYGQANSYMGKLDLKKCLFICTNKNNDDRYIEIINFDHQCFQYCEEIAQRIVSTDIPPYRVGGPLWFECKFCEYKEICHEDNNPDVTCRTCFMGTIESNGKWSCGGKKNLDEDAQRAACNNYELIETFRL